MNSMLKIFLFIWFYIGWFGCIYFAKTEWAIASLIFPLVSFLVLSRVHFFTKKLFFYLLAMALIGFTFDSALLRMGLVTFPDFRYTLAPVWLLSMWLLFVGALPLMHSFFGKRLIWAAMGGAIFGPLSYSYGASFGVLFLTSNVSLLVYALFWSVFFPITVAIQRKIL